MQKEIEIFNKYGINARINNQNKIIISHYKQPDNTTFKELGINEDELIKDVIGCSGKFETKNSALTTFPLFVSQQLILDSESKIEIMPNLKAVGSFVVGGNLKKLPKFRSAGVFIMENSHIKSLPKCSDVGLLVAQNSQLKELPLLETVKKMCIIDCPIDDLKSLKTADEIFICSTDEDNKNQLLSLKKLEEVNNIFIANSSLKALPSLKSAKNLAFYNCNIKSVKSSLKANVEIQNKISDDELANKFDKFVSGYRELLGNIEVQSLSEVLDIIKD